jgi:hypothetical protein
VGQLKPASAVSEVVAQHLTPDHPSLSVDLLANASTASTAATALPVVEVEAEISAVSLQGAAPRRLLVVHRS